MSAHAELAPGLVGDVEVVVGEAHLASALGSGGLDVLGTPALIALLERAARECVEHLLPHGTITVGTRVDVRHLAPTPMGAVVRAHAELIEVEGRRLVFRVTASDHVEAVAAGTHERAVVDGARLLARAQAKAQR